MLVWLVCMVLCDVVWFVSVCVRVLVCLFGLNVLVLYNCVCFVCGVLCGVVWLVFVCAFLSVLVCVRVCS